MQRNTHEFEKADVSVVVVTFETAARVRVYLGENEVPWPVLVDETREVYRAYGMLAGHFWDIWGLPTWWAYLKELARGRVPTRSDADILQLGGDVLVDPDGVVQFWHVGKGPADRPTVSTLLRARTSSA